MQGLVNSFWITVSWLFLFLLAADPSLAKSDKLTNITWQKTMEFYRQIPGLTQEQLDYGSQIILQLDYNSSRAFRKLCQAKEMNFIKSKESWSKLKTLDLSFEQILAFEEWSDLGTVHIDVALHALTKIKSLDYESGKAFRNYCKLPGVSPEHALQTIPLLSRLNDAQSRSVQQLLTLPDITAENALTGLGAITRMTYYQALALEALGKIPGMKTTMVLDSLPLMRMLSMESAWNAKTLFAEESVQPTRAWNWLVAFFANPTSVQEKQFHSFMTSDKKSLLQAFYRGGEEIIWKINNLHGVTDRFGYEISNRTLQGYSKKQLIGLFENLSPQVKSDFAVRFYATENHKTRIEILKKAISEERKETARRLTSANIYALLAQGSELYDSSFRNILVPVLKNEIEQSFKNNLLRFLQATDPGNILVSDFIVSLAQKGKLTTFFPRNSIEQEQILNLVARSAFRNENAIILFSATFMHLLDVLEPKARSFLVKKMAELADEGTATYAKLITVILQYYLEEYPDLLAPGDRSKIVRLIVRYGAVNLNDYLATPFTEWKRDGRLSSLSIFHPDDDGRDSFISNAKILMKSGYSLSLSGHFTDAPLDEKTEEYVQKLIRTTEKSPATGLPALFDAMLHQRFAISFIRYINGITINHATYVYTTEQRQEQLLERFVLSGTEMLAQRGHSYWRSEQLTDPLDKLKAQGRITDHELQEKQRFLSLGSCGGVKVYTLLYQMFQGRVDILATIGSGLSVINDPYNKMLFEVIAKNPGPINWKDVAGRLDFIFKGGHGRDYLQPGSLPAILHKILDEEKRRAKSKPKGQNVIKKKVILYPDYL